MVHPVLCSLRTGVITAGAWNHLPSYNTEVKNDWSSTTLPIAHNLKEEIFIFVFPFAWSRCIHERWVFWDMLQCIFVRNTRIWRELAPFSTPNIWRRQFPPLCRYPFTSAHNMSQNNLIRIYLIKISAQWPSVVSAVTNNRVPWNAECFLERLATIDSWIALFRGFSIFRRHRGVHKQAQITATCVTQSVLR